MEYRFLVAGSRRNRDSCCPRPLPEPRVPVDPIADVQHKLRSCTRDTLAVGHVIEGPLKLGMLVNVAADFLEALSCRFEALLEFSLGFDLSFAEGHLHAAVCVDFALTRSLDRQEDHVLEFVDYSRLHSVRLRRRHAPEGFQRQYHVAELVNGVIHILADFEMSLTATSKLVIERMRHVGQFRLWHESVTNSTKLLNGAMVEEIPHTLPSADAP